MLIRQFVLISIFLLKLTIGSSQPKRPICLDTGICLGSPITSTRLIEVSIPEHKQEIAKLFFPVAVSHILCMDSLKHTSGLRSDLITSAFKTACFADKGYLKSILLLYEDDISDIHSRVVKYYGTPHQVISLSSPENSSSPELLIDSGAYFWQFQDFYMLALVSTPDAKKIYNLGFYEGIKKISDSANR